MTTKIPRSQSAQVRSILAQVSKGKGRVRGAEKTQLDGITFHSKREAKRWAELQLLEKAGEISNLRRQVPLDLLGREDFIKTPTGKVMTYVCDFVYVDMKTHLTVYEDAKGHPTDTYKMKRAILDAMGIEIREV